MPNEKQKWIDLIQQVNEKQEQETDWKVWSNITTVGAVAVLAVFAGLVIFGTDKEKTV